MSAGSKNFIEQAIGKLGNKQVRILSAGADRKILLWNLKTQKLEQTFEGHTAAITALAVAPDGKRFSSSGQDQTIRIWNLPATR